MTDTPSAPVADLDLIRLPSIAAGLRHTSVRSSLGYIHPISDAGDPELEFVRAILTERLSVVHDEWYGGRFNAGRIAADLMDQVIGQLQAGASASEP